MHPIIIMYILLAPSASLFIYFKHKFAGQKGLKKIVPIVFKALSTGIILFTAIYWTKIAPESVRTYANLITAGLALGLAGDMAICFNIYPGMFFFGLGHIAYIIAELKVSEKVLWSIPVFIVLCLLVLTSYKISKLKIIKRKMTIPIIIYTIIILSMLSLAITIPFSIICSGIILLLGAVFFTASDSMLAINNIMSLGGQEGYNNLKRKMILGSYNNKLDVVCLYFYFIGQSLFAVSIYFMG